MSGIRRTDLGSTTCTVLRHSNIPVVAVPYDPSVPRALPSVGAAPTFVAALDLNDRSSANARRAARIAASLDATLILVHVVERVSTAAASGDFSDWRDRKRRAEADAAMNAITEELRNEFPNVEHRVLCGNAAYQLAAFVCTEGVGLLITFLADRPAVLRLRRGSVPYDVIACVPTPVLALSAR